MGEERTTSGRQVALGGVGSELCLTDSIDVAASNGGRQAGKRPGISSTIKKVIREEEEDPVGGWVRK